MFIVLLSRLFWRVLCFVNLLTFFVEINPLYDYTKDMIKFFETDETPTSDVIKVGDKFTIDDYKKYISLHPEVPIYETEYVYLSFDFLKKS